MYESIKEWMLWLMRVPPEPLDPMGDVASLRVFRAAPGYFRYSVLGWGIKQAIGLVVALSIMIALLVGASHGGGGPAMFIVIAVELLAVLLLPVGAFFSYFLLKLNYEMRWYKITDRSLRIREGVWSVHELTMTFANIQNITITQGPLQRFFGIADVRVETAGGGGAAMPQQHGAEGLGLNMHIGVFRGVDNAEEVRDLMLERLRRLRDTGLGDFDETAASAGEGFDRGRPETAAPAPAGATAWSPRGLAVLNALREEAAALRRAAQALGNG